MPAAAFGGVDYAQMLAAYQGLGFPNGPKKKPVLPGAQPDATGAPQGLYLPAREAPGPDGHYATSQEPQGLYGPPPAPPAPDPSGVTDSNWFSKPLWPQISGMLPQRQLAPDPSMRVGGPPAPQEPPPVSPAPTLPAGPQTPPGPPPGPPASPQGFAPPTPMQGAPGQAPQLSPPAAPPYQEASLRPMAPPSPDEPQAGPRAAGGKYAPSQITEALIRAGVPPEDAATLTAISGAESGYRPSAVGPKNRNGTTDYGLFQINSVHGDLNPASLPTADLDTQAQAAAAVYKKEGLGAWSTFNNGAYKGFLGGGGAGSPPGAAGRLEQAQSLSGPSIADQASQIGLNSDQVMDLAKKLGYQPVSSQIRPGDQMIAMGLGMMGGRTFADSMKNAGTAFSESRGQDLNAINSQNHSAMQLAQVGIDSQKFQQQLKQQDRQFGIAQSRLDLANQQFQTLEQHRLAQDKALAARTDGSTVMAAGKAKEGNAMADQMMTGARDSRLKLNQLNSLDALVQGGQTGVGPGGINAFQRQVAQTLGITLNGVDPVASQLAGALSSEARGSGIMGKNMRTQLEYNQIIEGLTNPNQSPGTMHTVINGLRNLEGLKSQLGDSWNQLTTAQKTHLRMEPDELNQWANGEIDKWQEGVNKSGGINNQVAPASGSSAGMATPPPGTKLRYDPATQTLVPG